MLLFCERDVTKDLLYKMFIIDVPTITMADYFLPSGEFVGYVRTTLLPEMKDVLLHFHFQRLNGFISD